MLTDALNRKLFKGFDKAETQKDLANFHFCGSGGINSVTSPEIKAPPASTFGKRSNSL